MAADLINVESDIFKVDHDHWPQYHEYKSLDISKREIRLLKMFKQKSNNLLNFEFLHQSLNDKPKYSALSYCWGILAGYQTILINETAVQIRETLYHFLNCLWLRFGSIVIWLDVLCINQQDIMERNMQVTIMASIFQSAENVFSWLGHGDPDCEYAMTQVVPSGSARADLNVE